MKVKKQRKITAIQLRAVEKKLKILEQQRQRIAARTIPLRATLKEFILQNGIALERYSRAAHPGSARLTWALSKIKRGYFYDATLKRLVAIAHILDNVKWEK